MEVNTKPSPSKINVGRASSNLGVGKMLRNIPQTVALHTKMAKGKTKNTSPVSVVKMKPLTMRLDRKMLKTSVGKLHSVNADPGNSVSSMGGGDHKRCVSKVLIKIEPK